LLKPEEMRHTVRVEVDRAIRGRAADIIGDTNWDVEPIHKGNCVDHQSDTMLKK
jgi:hypothetical protein